MGFRSRAAAAAAGRRDRSARGRGRSVAWLRHGGAWIAPEHSNSSGGVRMAEVLVRYTTTVRGADGTPWVPQACGGIAKDGLWEGWIEFVSDQRAVRTARETEQPNRDDLMCWAQGLTDTYLDGALARATTERQVIPREPRLSPRFGGPKRATAPRGFRVRAILDPFATYAQGEDLLRGQLTALSHDNLVAIVEDYALPVHGTSDMRSSRLVDEIIGAVIAAHQTGGSADRQIADSDNPSIRQPDDRAR